MQNQEKLHIPNLDDFTDSNDGMNKELIDNAEQLTAIEQKQLKQWVNGENPLMFESVVSYILETVGTHIENKRHQLKVYHDFCMKLEDRLEEGEEE